MDQRPKAGIVKVIDVAIHLPPAQVVPDVAEGGVQDHSAIERWRILEICIREEAWPVINIGSRKARHHSGHDFAINIRGGLQ